MSTKILLVDDHSIILDGLESMLNADPNLQVAGKLNSASFALAHLKSSHFDLMISDFSMPDMNGLELVKQAKAVNPALKIIVLSMHDEPELVREIIRAGVDGYVLKKYSHEELIQAVKIVCGGGQYWSPEVNRILIRGISPEQNKEVNITERELGVLKLLVEELNNREIAERLFISERTVETHRKNLMRKTGSTNSIGLIKFAYSNNLI